MDLKINQEALGLGAYQSLLAVVGIAILLWLGWRAARAIIKRSRNKTRMTEREILTYAWPPFAWLAIFLIAGVTFSTMQAYGPRVAIPPTKLQVNAPDADNAVVRDLSPKRLSDEERLQKQRELEAETKSRVNLKE